MEIKGPPEWKNMSSPFPFALPHPLQNIFFQSSVMSSLGQGEGVMQWHSTDTCVKSLGASMVGTSMKENYKEDLLQFSVTSVTKRHLHSL